MSSSGASWARTPEGEAAARVARLIFYVLLAIVLMALDYRGRYVPTVRSLAWQATEPVLLTLEMPFALARRLGEQLRVRHELMQHIDALERERIARTAELALLAELRDDNQELRALLAASQQIQPRFQAAELMDLGLNPWSHRVLINRGRRDGIYRGQPVVDTRGIMGQVDEVALGTAQVILISDPDHALPVRVQRTGLRTVAYGTGHINQLRLNDLPMNVDLEPGDVLLTSGLGDVFPAGLPVAEVEEVTRPRGEVFAQARMRPLARLDRARHVLVVDMTTPDEEASEINSAATSPESLPTAPAAADLEAEAAPEAAAVSSGEREP